jgi:hypothetical protein
VDIDLEKYPGIAKHLKREQDGPAWMRECLCGDKGVPYPNLANALTALRGDPALSELFAYDLMMQAPLLTRPLALIVPEGESGPVDKDRKPRPVTDGDVARVQEYLQHAGLRNIGREAVFQAVNTSAEDNSFHPVRDYLDGLAWDGTRRVDGWLATYLGVHGGSL